MTALSTTDAALAELEGHRRELTGFCYRMLGSTFDADDAVQETFVRAWRGLDRFEGRSSLRSWLYRIATNACLDSLRGRQRRALPMDLSSPVPSHTPPGQPLPEQTWVSPVPDGDVVPAGDDPAERAVFQDTIRLAFVAALQHLAPRQRAVLILREVLCWQAAEVAELLDTTVASVNSALQRARATLAACDLSGGAPSPLSPTDRDLLSRYVQAFERYDIDTLVQLLSEDASISMPPLELWLRGREDLRGWYLGTGIGCRGSRLVPTAANGSPAFGQYRASGPGGRHEPWSLQCSNCQPAGSSTCTTSWTRRCSPASACPRAPTPSGRPPARARTAMSFRRRRRLPCVRPHPPNGRAPWDSRSCTSRSCERTAPHWATSSGSSRPIPSSTHPFPRRTAPWLE